MDVTKLHVIPHPRPIDYVTEIEFKREVKQPDSAFKEMVLNNVCYYSEYSHLHSGDKAKDNWKNYPKVMMRTRNLAAGYRMIAGDALNGLYEDSEIADTTNISYNIDKSGKVDFPTKQEDNIEEVEVIDEKE